MQGNKQTIRIFVREHETKKDGKNKKFYTSSWTPDGQSFYKVKATQDAGNVLPSKVGFYQLSFLDTRVSVQKGKKLENGKTENPTLWINDPEATYVRDLEHEQKLEQEKIKELRTMFDEANMPF